MELSRHVGLITTNRIIGFTSVRSTRTAKRDGALIAEGRHGLAKNSRVPLFDLRVRKGCG